MSDIPLTEDKNESKESNNFFETQVEQNNMKYNLIIPVKKDTVTFIKKLKDKILLILYIEVLLKQQEIEIELFPIKNDIDSNIRELYQELINIKKSITNIEELKKEINELKNDNKKLITIIEDQNNEIQLLKDTLFNFMNRSVIMGDDEKNLLLKEIEKKMNQKIKQIKKLYQATTDGSKPIIFIINVIIFQIY